MRRSMSGKRSCAGGARLTKLLGVAILAAGLSGCLGYDGEIPRGYVVDPSALEQVKPGSSAEQVLVVMGTPSTTSTVGGDAWYYISQQTNRSLAFSPRQVTDQRVVAVYFTKNKRVERIANYGMQDGKVFDFVSRTTPTAGSEPSFIRNALQGLLRF
jgi:outer membrane protein assembly factor BamE (lipoprotein component of BamABCDE complex)